MEGLIKESKNSEGERETTSVGEETKEQNKQMASADKTTEKSRYCKGKRCIKFLDDELKEITENYSQSTGKYKMSENFEQKNEVTLSIVEVRKEEKEALNLCENNQSLLARTRKPKAEGRGHFPSEEYKREDEEKTLNSTERREFIIQGDRSPRMEMERRSISSILHILVRRSKGPQ